MAADNEKLEQLRRQLDEVMPEIPARFWLNLETEYQLTGALVNKRSKVG
ncbi:MAG: Addiction module antidote protein, HigA family [Dehalococcoidia bacterium]|nr:Addiction module antidote protein, HigA family [Dehalococcoidia bacterium]